MTKRPKLKIVKETVVDRQGNVVGERPEDFVRLANSCKALAALVKTGQEHKVSGE